MNYYLIAQTTYSYLELGLFCRKKGLLAQEQIPNKEISKVFVTKIAAMLTAHDQTVQSLSCIAATQGPAPFTSLRASLAIINGIAFAHKIPLVGISTIKTLLAHHNNIPTIALFNAFGKDVYYGIANADSMSTHSTNTDQINTEGVIPLHTLLSQIAHIYTNQSQPIQFIGPAVRLWQKDIQKQFATVHVLIKPEIRYPSLIEIDQEVIKKHRNHAFSWQLLPEYFKPAVQQFNCS